MSSAPPREVTRLLELYGKRGGLTLVHVLTCGHWMTFRTPRKTAACVGCWVESQLAVDAARRETT